jgi:hypothetical protein
VDSPRRTAKWPRKSIGGPSPQKIFSSFSWLSSEPIDHCLGVCAAFFIAGLQPRGCTKQLIRVEAGRPFAWVRRLPARWLAPSKIMRSPRRPFQTPRSRSRERSPFGVGSARGQPRSKVVPVPYAVLWGAESCRGPIKATRSGTLAHGCVAGSSSPVWQHPGWRSSLACLRSAVWLPGTIGPALLGCRHGFSLLTGVLESCRSTAACRPQLRPGTTIVDGRHGGSPRGTEKRNPYRGGRRSARCRPRWPARAATRCGLGRACR